MKRVVVTGMAGVTALGHDWPTIEARLRAGRNAVRPMPEWDYFEALHTRLACPIDDFAAPRWLRPKTGSMGRAAPFATSENALRDAYAEARP